MIQFIYMIYVYNEEFIIGSTESEPSSESAVGSDSD